MSKVASWLRQLLRSWLTPPISSRVNSRTLPTTSSTTTAAAADELLVDFKKSISALQNGAGESISDRRVFVAKMSRNVNYIMLRTHMSQGKLETCRHSMRLSSWTLHVGHVILFFLVGEVKKSFVYRYANGLSTVSKKQPPWNHVF